MIAATLHPYFKLNWIENKEKNDTIKQQIKQYFIQDEESPLSEKSTTSFDDYLSCPTVSLHRPDEVEDYFRDTSTDMSSLERYKQIKNLFIQFNTAIPSSAPVERLFSQASLVHTIRRNRLSDSLLEQLILLKIHKKI